MTIARTSLLAYEEIKPTLADKHSKVMEVFEKGDHSNSEMAEALGWPINTVTPRVNELRKRGLITQVDTRKCKVTGRIVKVWGFPQEDNGRRLQNDSNTWRYDNIHVTTGQGCATLF